MPSVTCWDCQYLDPEIPSCELGLLGLPAKATLEQQQEALAIKRDDCPGFEYAQPGWERKPFHKDNSKFNLQHVIQLGQDNLGLGRPISKNSKTWDQKQRKQVEDAPLHFKADEGRTKQLGEIQEHIDGHGVIRLDPHLAGIKNASTWSQHKTTDSRKSVPAPFDWDDNWEAYMAEFGAETAMEASEGAGQVNDGNGFFEDLSVFHQVDYTDAENRPGEEDLPVGDIGDPSAIIGQERPRDISPTLTYPFPIMSTRDVVLTHYRGTKSLQDAADVVGTYQPGYTKQAAHKVIQADRKDKANLLHHPELSSTIKRAQKILRDYFQKYLTPEQISEKYDVSLEHVQHLTSLPEARRFEYLLKKVKKRSKKSNYRGTERQQVADTAFFLDPSVKQPQIKLRKKIKKPEDTNE